MSKKEKEPAMRIGTNICLKCQKIIYRPPKDVFMLIDDMPLVECPICKSKENVVKLVEIISEETIYVDKIIDNLEEYKDDE